MIPPKTPILTSELLWRIVLVGSMLFLGAFGLFEWSLASGASDAVARTVTVNAFVLVELFYLFHSAPISVMDWVHIVAVSLLIYLVISVEKSIRRRREAGSSKP